MKAIVQEEYGLADVLRFEHVEKPVAGRGEVLIRVIAASAFIGDWHVMTGNAVRDPPRLRAADAQAAGPRSGRRRRDRGRRRGRHRVPPGATRVVGIGNGIHY